MEQIISRPSKLRREIVALVKLNPKSDRRDIEKEADDRIEQIIFEIMDLACSFLQGGTPSNETKARFDSIWGEAEECKNLKILTNKQKQMINQIERHFQEVQNLCQDPFLSEDLQNEKVAVPSYSKFTETILLTNGQLMAESFRLFLESFGIQAILGRESAGIVYGLTVGPLGEVDVNVTPDNAADAKILIQAMKKGYFVMENELDLIDENHSSGSDSDEWSDETTDDFDNDLDEDIPEV